MCAPTAPEVSRHRGLSQLRGRDPQGGGPALGVTQVPYRMFFAREVGISDVTTRGLLDVYTLKKRLYLGPTSMDTELALVMCNMGQVSVRPFDRAPKLTAGGSVDGPSKRRRTRCDGAHPGVQAAPVM